MFRVSGAAVVAALVFSAVASPAAAGGLDVRGWLDKPGTRMLAVELYATWCKPCMEAVPKWKALHEKYRREGLRLVVIATQDPEGGCVNPGWNPDEVVCDEDGSIARALGAGERLPAAFLWSWQGQLLVRQGHVGDVDAAIKQWMRSSPRIDVQAGEVERGARVSKKALVELIRAQLGDRDKVDVVASDAERAKLAQVRAESLKARYADDRQCEIGQELSANSLLEANVRKIAGRWRLSLSLFSAERGCLVATALADWAKGKERVAAAEAVSSLLQKLRPSLQMPGSSASGSSARAGGTDYRRLAAEAENAERKRNEWRVSVEEAWSAVARYAAVESIAKAERKAAVERFLADFPRDNPRAEDARQLLRELEAGAAGSPGGEMVRVPAGPFLMGCNVRVDAECERDEKPRMVEVAAFRIDKTEVTVAAYAACVKAGGCSAQGLESKFFDDRDQGITESCNWNKPGREQHPINCVDWSHADAYCRWAKKRLPTEAEWEKAARGTDGLKYTWGNDGFGTRLVANIADERAKRNWPYWSTAPGYDDGFLFTAPVGSFVDGASPYGALDLIGNVWEWTADWEKSGKTRVLRGGSWSDGPRETRTSRRVGVPPTERASHAGFRCARTE